MQSVAVLLLEMTYQKRDTGNSDPKIIAAIKKMMHWLRVMKQNDPVSEKAYKVIRKILLEVAPSLQTLSHELLRYGEGPSAPSEHITPQGSETHIVTQTNDHVPRHGVELVSPAASGATVPQLAPQQEWQHSYNLPYDSHQIPAMQDHTIPTSFGNHTIPTSFGNHTIPTSFGNPFFTFFDQDAPFANVQGLCAGSAPLDNVDTNWPNWDVPHEYQPGNNNQDMDMNYEREN
jgi:hypothetical protein